MWLHGGIESRVFQDRRAYKPESQTQLAMYFVCSKLQRTRRVVEMEVTEYLEGALSQCAASHGMVAPFLYPSCSSVFSQSTDVCE